MVFHPISAGIYHYLFMLKFTLNHVSKRNNFHKMVPTWIRIWQVSYIITRTTCMPSRTMRPLRLPAGGSCAARTSSKSSVSMSSKLGMSSNSCSWFRQKTACLSVELMLRVSSAFPHLCRVAGVSPHNGHLLLSDSFLLRQPAKRRECNVC